MDLIGVCEDIRAALADGRPVLALESSVIAHGLSYPANLRIAHSVEDAVRVAGAIVASVGIDVIATGGIGGVHRGDTGDVSADLLESKLAKKGRQRMTTEPHTPGDGSATGRTAVSGVRVFDGREIAADESSHRPTMWLC